MYILIPVLTLPDFADFCDPDLCLLSDYSEISFLPPTLTYYCYYNFVFGISAPFLFFSGVCTYVSVQDNNLIPIAWK
ncbi:hypothetical protein XELAEV_18027575mg [Xenopus laevis]|uniref:Uncharacterized protein n=1 Tax=Xenopus laevis TaxID=8355 RepID=A0A974HK36_XENLA|nr:hypothetical protein XELAEV_18027575mg [Xenopus laevis]